MSSVGSSELHEIVARLEVEVATLRSSRRRLAEANHSERRAIERELHDGVQQHLVALAVDLQRLAGLVDDRDAAEALIAEVRGNIRAAIDEATRLATKIYPPIVGARGLAAALRSAAGDAGVVALVDVPASADYPPEIIAALYRTWVEAISAAPSGSEAGIKVLAGGEGLSFEVTVARRLSDGRVEGMKDGIEALDGRLSVDDRRDGSSRLQGSLPLP